MCLIFLKFAGIRACPRVRGYPRIAGMGFVFYPWRVVGAGAGTNLGLRCGFVKLVFTRILPVAIYNQVAAADSRRPTRGGSGDYGRSDVQSSLPPLSSYPLSLSRLLSRDAAAGTTPAGVLRWVAAAAFFLASLSSCRLRANSAHCARRAHPPTGARQPREPLFFYRFVRAGEASPHKREL